MPSIWRIELLHPMLVHFPIALLSLGVFVRLLSLFPTRLRALLLGGSQVLIALGAATAWMAIVAGDLSEEVVNQYLCDPELTHQHGDWAERATWTFTLVAAMDLLSLDGIRRRLKIPKWLNQSTAIVSVLLSILALLILIKASHDGATLTYQLGAGVYKPDEKCTGIGN